MKDKESNFSTELNFLCNKYIEFPSPDHCYLLKYCRNDIQKQFMLYYLTFGEYIHFEYRTGISQSKRWRELMRRKFEKITHEFDIAMKSGDFEKVSLIKDGKLKI